MRPHRFVLIALLCVSSTFTGCIDVAVRYLVRENGSVRIDYDIVLDKMFLQLLYAMPEPNAETGDSLVIHDTIGIAARMSQSVSIGDTTDDLELDNARRDSLRAFGESAQTQNDDSSEKSGGKSQLMASLLSGMKPFKMTKEISDSIRRRLFGEELARRAALEGVSASYSKDSLAYDGVHLLFTTELRSYKNIGILQRTDSVRAKSGKHFHFSDSIFVAESGDSVMFNAGTLKNVTQGAQSDFPMMRDLDGMYKKTSFHPDGAGGVLVQGTRAIAIDYRKPKHHKRATPHATAPDSSADAGDATASDGAEKPGSDAMMGMVAGMLSGMINFDLSIESPLLLSAAAGAEFDSLHHRASWHLDLASIMAAKSKSQPDEPLQEYYIWFRKPHQADR